MRHFVILITVAIPVCGASLALHKILLRAFDVPVSAKTPEEQAARRERILRMGKLRFILVFGVFGMGSAIGLIAAISGLVAHESDGWFGAAFKLAYWMAASAWLYGLRVWNESYRGEVPFPPHFPPQK